MVLVASRRRSTSFVVMIAETVKIEFNEESCLAILLVVHSFTVLQRTIGPYSILQHVDADVDVDVDFGLMLKVVLDEHHPIAYY